MQINEPLSSRNVISTQVLVLERMISNFRQEIPEANIVYDEYLSYNTAVIKFRRDNVMNDSTPLSTYPLFAFKRSVLRYADKGRSRRSKALRVSNSISETTLKVYKSLHGEFDVDFLYITKSIDDLERFEVCYLSEEGISGYRQLEVDLSAEFGEGAIFSYFAEYEDLQDMSFEEEAVYYKMVTGTIKIRGEYPILIGEQGKILQVNAKINSFLSSVKLSVNMSEDLISKVVEP